MEWFESIWNWLDIMSWGLNIAFIVCDLTNVESRHTYPLGAAAVGLIWIKLFYFLRLFSPTSFMIRLLFEVFQDMFSFGFVLMLAMWAFGNIFYVLDTNSFQIDTINYNNLSDPNATYYDSTATEPSHIIG